MVQMTVGSRSPRPRSKANPAKRMMVQAGYFLHGEIVIRPARPGAESCSRRAIHVQSDMHSAFSRLEARFVVGVPCPRSTRWVVSRQNDLDSREPGRLCSASAGLWIPPAKFRHSCSHVYRKGQVYICSKSKGIPDAPWHAPCTVPCPTAGSHPLPWDGTWMQIRFPTELLFLEAHADVTERWTGTGSNDKHLGLLVRVLAF